MPLYPSDFDYKLSSDLIALEPARRRAESRLLVHERKKDLSQLTQFQNLPAFLRSGDLLVFNQTRVMRARFLAKRKTGAQLEGLFLREKNLLSLVWLKGHVHSGEEIELFEGSSTKVIERYEKEALLSISASEFRDYLEQKGFLPIPPYIRAERERRGLSALQVDDEFRYQSLRAVSRASSVAAPTASLHFDEEIFRRLELAGVELVDLNLCVGSGTFEPLVDSTDIFSQSLHSEKVQISVQSIEKIKKAKLENRRVIAVGTTSLRALESWAIKNELEFETDLFVRPGFEFKIVDALITNFHWPKSSLLILVASFLGYSQSSNEKWKKLYELAMRENFRFFSYGDAMLVL